MLGLQQVDARVTAAAHEFVQAHDQLATITVAVSRISRQSPLWIVTVTLTAAVAPRHTPDVMRAITAAGVAKLSAAAIKHVVQRPRPASARHEPADSPDGLSFPSTYTAMLFAAAAGLSNTTAPPLAFGLAAVLASTRVLLGEHHVSDVLAGAALGTLTGHATTQATRRL